MSTTTTTSTSIASSSSLSQHQFLFFAGVPLLAWWIATYWYYDGVRGEWYKRYAIHNLHNGIAILMGIASLAWKIDERLPIAWSLTYFVVDIADCFRRRDVTYAVHAAFCLLLGAGNWTSPTCLRLRMNSKATFCELSNPFLHLSKNTRRPLHFAAFALVFACCRIVWIPVMIHLLRAAGMTYWWYHSESIGDAASKVIPPDLRLWGVTGFYLMNCFWFVKILRILWTGGSGRGEGKGKGGGGKENGKSEKED